MTMYCPFSFSLPLKERNKVVHSLLPKRKKRERKRELVAQRVALCLPFFIAIYMNLGVFQCI